MKAIDWTRSLRSLQIGSILLPFLIFIAWSLWAWDRERAKAVSEAINNVELIRQYSLRVIQSQESVLRDVADYLDDADLATVDSEELHRQLARHARRDAYMLGIGVVSPDGRLVASSRLHPIDERVDDRNYFRALRDGAEMQIERITTRPSGLQALSVAIRRSGEPFAGILAGVISIEAFTDFFGRIAVDERAAASLLRRDGMLLVRHTPDAPAIMLPDDAPGRIATRQADEGVYEAVAVSDGIARIYAFARVGDLPVIANFGVPRSAIFESWRREMAIAGAFLAVVALLGLFGTTQVGRRLRAEQARRQAEFDRRLLAEAQRAAEMRETLLREVHHRTKNNLQMIQSLIKIRSRGSRGNALVDEIEKRIWAIAQVHDLLYTSQEFSRLDLGAFLNNVCRSPAIVPPELPIQAHCDVERVELDINAAIPIALIVIELVTNAIKHAFPEGRPGSIGIILRRSDDHAIITVTDDGIGVPDGASRDSGMRLVRGLVRQIGGEIEAPESGGTQYRIIFPIDAETQSDG